MFRITSNHINSVVNRAVCCSKYLLKVKNNCRFIHDDSKPTNGIMIDYLSICESENRRSLLRKLDEEPRTGGVLMPLGLLESSLKGIGVLDVVIDRWPDFTTVLIRSDPRKLGLYGSNMRISLYSTNNEVLENLLNTPGVIPWHIPIQFKGIPKRSVSTVHAAIERSSQGGCVTYSKDYHVLDFSTACLSNCKLPTFYTFGNLTAEDAPFVNSVWELGGGKERTKFIEYLISRAGGFSILDPNGQIVGVSVFMFDGSFGMGWVDPKCRGLGLIGNLNTIAAKTSILQKKKYLYGHIRPENIASLKGTSKTGAVCFDDKVTHIGYEPKLNSVKSYMTPKL